MTTFCDDVGNSTNFGYLLRPLLPTSKLGGYNIRKEFFHWYKSVSLFVSYDTVNIF